VRVLSTSLPGVLVIEPVVHRDDRGVFVETYHQDRYRAAGIAAPFVQDNHSSSRKGTVRGLHLQARRPQGKLIRVVEGTIYDVAVDVRCGSPTFGRWVAITLDAASFRQCYVPPGFAHGFSVLSDVAVVEYKCTDVYDPESEVGIAWNDPVLAIPWPVERPVLSPRDRRNPALREVMPLLPVYDAADL
jgi:dTDP-4-dehydrorhamnose 3,5-epimerase